MDAFIGFLAQNLNSSVFVLLIILIAVFILLFKAGGYLERLKNQDGRLSKMEEISTNVTTMLNRVDIKTDSQDKRLCKTEDIAGSIIALQTKVDLIYQNTLKNPTVIARSPITLTELGKDIIKNVNGRGGICQPNQRL